MINELSNKIIFEDFKNKMILTDDEEKILLMLVKKYSIIKMSQEINLSDRTVERIIKNLKIKYGNYKKIELAKYEIFKAG